MLKLVHFLYLVCHCSLTKNIKREIPTCISEMQSSGRRARCLALRKDRLAFGWTRADTAGLMSGPGKTIPYKNIDIDCQASWGEV